MSRYVEQARELDTLDYTEEMAFNRLLGHAIRKARMKRGGESFGDFLRETFSAEDS